MNRARVFGLGLLALVAMGVMAASVSALTLPDMHVVLSGGTYPVVAVGERVSATNLLTIGGSTLTGTLTKLTLKITELTSLGLFTVDFTGVKEGTTNKCKSNGDAAETVLSWGEFHLVPGVKKELLVLFLPSGFTIQCGTTEAPEKVKIKVKGDALGTVIATLNTELTTFGGLLEGTKGKQNITEYLNDSGETVAKTFLQAEFGLGYEQAAETVTGAITLKVEGGQMVEILP